MGRAGPMGQLIMDFTGPVLGWAWSTLARAGLGRELVSPWRTLVPCDFDISPAFAGVFRHPRLAGGGGA